MDKHNLYQERLESGLNITVINKPGFYETYFMLSVPFGSLAMPDGLAHFLEHLVFQMPDGENVWEGFADRGAAVNAFTTFEMTSYLVSCTEQAEANLGSLLAFVTTPHFTEAGVEREKGIIGQEIRMHEDNARVRVFFNLLQGMYGADHPLSTPVAGTPEGLSRIDHESLERCYRAFYTPAHMSLLAVGDMRPEQVTAVARSFFAAARDEAPVEAAYTPKVKAASGVLQARVEAQMRVARPKLFLGYKDVAGGRQGDELLRLEYLTLVGLEAMAGKSSPLFQRLYQRNLIDKGFSCSYEAGLHYAHSVLGGDCDDPELVLTEWQAEVRRLLADGLLEEDFQRARAKLIGRVLELIDSPRALCRNAAGYEVRGADFFEIVPLLERMTRAQVEARLREHLVEARFCVSVVRP